MFRLSIFLAFAALFSCKGGEKAGAGSAPLVQLETGPCFGHCPVFRLTVLNNGRMQYEGIRFTEKTGRDSAQLTRAEFSRLRKKVQQVNVWQFPDRIPSNVVDAPTATLSVFKTRDKKSVTGSVDRPVPLLELENQLKDLAEAHGWQVKRGVNPDLLPADSRAELIVSLKPEVNAGNWIRQFSEFRFQLIRRLPEGNTWRVAYDPKQIDEKAVLDLFKNSVDVLEVRPR